MSFAPWSVDLTQIAGTYDRIGQGDCGAVWAYFFDGNSPNRIRLQCLPRCQRHYERVIRQQIIDSL